MTTFVRLLGVVGVIGGIGALVFAVYLTLNLKPAEAAIMLSYGLGALLAGALLYCFGMIADQLHIQTSIHEKQLSALREMTERSRDRSV